MSHASPDESDVGMIQTASPGLGHHFGRIRVHARSAGTIQTKSAINSSGDEPEQEAHHASDHVMRMPEPRLQRACGCGDQISAVGSCGECDKKNEVGLQTKLRINEPGDMYEQEADRIADQVLVAPRGSAAFNPTAESQCLSGQSAGQTHGKINTVPASVDHALAGPGKALEPAIRNDMEQRFGHDFSRVRVHSGQIAEQSAHEVSALAYTVGQNIVFGKGQYSPHSLRGQRLIAHELVHTLQQKMSSGPERRLHRQGSLDIALRSPGVAAQIFGTEILDGFALNSPALTADHKRRLLALAKRLKQLLLEYPQGTFEIIGHTDATGGEALNDQLGQDRADSVVAFLLKAGVRAIALQSESAGESALRVPTEKAEPRNRRVEIRFLPELPVTAPSPPTPEAVKPTKEPVGIPSPENLCSERPEICEPIITKPELTQSCHPSNCSAVSVDPFDKQPPDFQLMLIKSFGTRDKAAAWFKELDPDRSMALALIFNRLCDYGLLCQIRLVVKVDAGEPPVSFLDREFNVPGLTPSVYFTRPVGADLTMALLDTGRFCLAYGAGASQHPGKTLREISGTDSLHISEEGKELVEAHIDKYSPVLEHPDGTFCSNEPTPSNVTHIGRELFSEKFRKLMRQLTGWMRFGALGNLREILRTLSAGVQLFPDFELTPAVPQREPENRSDTTSKPVVGLTWRGPVERTRKRAATKPVAPDVLRVPNDVVDAIRSALEAEVNPDGLVPPDLMTRLAEARELADKAGLDEEKALVKVRDALEEEAANYSDAHDVAFDLAAQMEQARRKDRKWVKLDLDNYGRYGILDGDGRRAIVKAIRRIALIVKPLLTDGAPRVDTIVLIFGTDNLAVREEIKLPGWVNPIHEVAPGIWWSD